MDNADTPPRLVVEPVVEPVMEPIVRQAAALLKVSHLLPKHSASRAQLKDEPGPERRHGPSTLGQVSFIHPAPSRTAGDGGGRRCPGPGRGRPRGGPCSSTPACLVAFHRSAGRAPGSSNRAA
jgi:hypothetical protein